MAGGDIAGTPNLTSFETVLGAIAADLDAVAGDGTTAWLAEHLTAVPAAVTDFFGFEVRADSPGVDLLLQLHPRRTLDACVAGTLAGSVRDVEESLRRLLAGAATDDDLDPLACKDVWVEYDVGVRAFRPAGRVAAPRLPAPSLFCAPRRFEPPDDGAVHRVLAGEHADADLAAEIERDLWPGAVAFQRGAMRSRPHSPARLCLACNDQPGDVVARLRRWVADRRAWDRIAASASEIAAELSFGASRILDVEIRDGTVQPVIGVELTAREAAALDGVLAGLEERHLADTDWFSAVRGWHGDVVAHDASEAAELGVRPPVAVLGRVIEFGLMRRVNHFKVTHRPGCKPGVKAYLGVRAGSRMLRRPRSGRFSPASGVRPGLGSRA